MSDERSVEQAGLGTVRLGSVDELSSHESDDGDSYTIHGVAIGIDDVTYGASRTLKIWPAETLREAAETLIGKPLVRDHINTTRGKIGMVTHAEFVDGVGIVYEAEVASHYEDIVQDIDAGLMEVSVRAYHTPEEELDEDDRGVLIVEDALFDNLSVVNQGAAPSSSADTGPVEQSGYDTAEASAVIDTGSGEYSVATLERSVDIAEVTDSLADANSTSDDEQLSLTSSDVSDTTQPHRMEDDGDEDDEDENSVVENLSSIPGTYTADGTVFAVSPDEHNDDSTEHADDAKYPLTSCTGSNSVEAAWNLRSHGDYTISQDALESRIRAAAESMDCDPSIVGLGDSNEAADELSEQLSWNDVSYDGEELVDAVEWEDGDWVEWQVNSDMKGKVVHVDHDRYIVMVDVHVVEDGELVSTGVTVSAGYADLLPADSSEYEYNGNSSDDEIITGHWVTWGSDDGDQLVGKVVGKRDDDGETLLEIQQYTRQNGVYKKEGERMEMVDEDVALWEQTPDKTVVEDDDGDVDVNGDENDDELGALWNRRLDELDRPPASMDELDDVYSDWDDAVNMTASELKQWAENPCAHEASVDSDAVISRNLRLLETAKDDWDVDDISDAKRTISFIERMSADGNKPDDPRDGTHGCPSPWAISLLNWAFNPFDSIPSVPDEIEENNNSRNTNSHMDNDELSVEGGDERLDGYVPVAYRDYTMHHDPDAFVDCGINVTDGTELTIPRVHATRDVSVSVHPRGDDYPWHTPSLGGNIGQSETLEADTVHEDVTISIDDGHEIDSSRELFVLMYYEVDGERRHHVLGADGWVCEKLDVYVSDDISGSTVVDYIGEQRDVISYSNEELSVNYEDHTYDSEEDAEAASEEMPPPCEVGAHEEDGSYMPCATHSQLEEALSNEEEMEDEESDEYDDEYESEEDEEDEEEMDEDEYESHDGDDADDDEYEDEDEDEDDEDEYDEEEMSAQIVPLASLTDTEELSSVDSASVSHTTSGTMIDYEPANAEELSQKADEPVVVERSDLEELSEKAQTADKVEEELGALSERLESQDEAAQVVEELSDEDIDLIQSDDDVTVVELSAAEMFGEVQEIYAEELAEYAPFSAEELASKFSPSELKARLDEHDEAELSRSIGNTDPEPESGTVETEELSGENEEERQARAQFADRLEKKGWTTQAKKVRNGELGVQ